GYLDDIRIYNYVRTPAQIAWEYNQGASVAWYRLDECTGNTAYNAAKNANGQAIGNNGTIIIGASGTQTSTGSCSSGTSTQAWNNGTNGKFNGSLNFDGTDDYVVTADNDSIDFAADQDFSVGVWFKAPLSGNPANATIVEKWNNTGGYPFAIRFLGDTNDTPHRVYVARSDGTNNPIIISNKTYNDNQWHFVTFVKNGSTLYQYIDAKDVKTITDSTTGTTANSSGLGIGRRVDVANSYFKGQIDEVKIFNYALTPAQIKTEMTGGAVRFE
ncbi:MAG TPA: LamG domain-containing protein, partial [Candidatus Woesebacteria bacterium]|nr:LamG domain-containing protein [Candidatus Woesebacteria bacterium]